MKAVDPTNLEEMLKKLMSGQTELEALQDQQAAAIAPVNKGLLNEGQGFGSFFNDPTDNQRAGMLQTGLSLLASHDTNNLSQRIGQAIGQGVTAIQEGRELDQQRDIQKTGLDINKVQGRQQHAQALANIGLQAKKVEDAERQRVISNSLAERTEDRLNKQLQISLDAEARLAAAGGNEVDRLDIMREANDIRRDELNQRIHEHDNPQLSVAMQKAADKSELDAFDHGTKANRLELLERDLRKRSVGGGFPSSVAEAFKSFFGTQEDVTAVRKGLNNARAFVAQMNLPPGTASDADVALALSETPPENANKETILQFIRGYAKILRLSEAHNMFRSSYIAENRGSSGANAAWSKQLEDDEFVSNLFENIGGIDSLDDSGVSATFDSNNNSQIKFLGIKRQGDPGGDIVDQIPEPDKF